jgi:hypothetical protein
MLGYAFSILWEFIRFCRGGKPPAESAYGSIEAVLPLLHDLMEKWSHYVAGE